MTQGYPHLTGKSLVQKLNCIQLRVTINRESWIRYPRQGGCLTHILKNATDGLKIVLTMGGGLTCRFLHKNYCGVPQKNVKNCCEVIWKADIRHPLYYLFKWNNPKWCLPRDHYLTRAVMFSVHGVLLKKQRIRRLSPLLRNLVWISRNLWRLGDLVIKVIFTLNPELFMIN